MTHQGQFHRIENMTSLPRPTQKPRPKFYVAAIQTEETFEYAGRNGHAVMAIPLGRGLKSLLEIYRDAWRKAGHPGNGEVMVAYHMLCHEDAKSAREIARAPFDAYMRVLAEAASEWTSGASSRDYRDYDKTIARLKSVTLEAQIESGSAWVGSPAEIKEAIGRAVELAGPFEHASLQINFANLDFAAAQASLRLFARGCCRILFPQSHESQPAVGGSEPHARPMKNHGGPYPTGPVAVVLQTPRHWTGRAGADRVIAKRQHRQGGM